MTVGKVNTTTPGDVTPNGYNTIETSDVNGESFASEIPLEDILPYNANRNSISGSQLICLKDQLYMGEELLYVVPRYGVNKFILFMFTSLMSCIFLNSFLAVVYFFVEYYWTILIICSSIIVSIFFALMVSYLRKSKKPDNYIGVTRDRIILSLSSIYQKDDDGKIIRQINPKSIQFRNIEDLKVYKPSIFNKCWSCYIVLREPFKEKHDSSNVYDNFLLFDSKNEKEFFFLIKLINRIRNDYWEFYDKEEAISPTKKFVPESVW
eukprot:TRINITY_DN871_c0_g2_i1.p1 TRINITY_DN871_c0_g2~~TRINITY_DN871_c0_g2_i1.p1  ORF type:complete len:265 (-),score=29.17 TRINITY_DN871_c0_g2_i1:143-937(-)